MQNVILDQGDLFRIIPEQAVGTGQPDNALIVDGQIVDLKVLGG
jgi:hypothetical protein